MHRVKIDNHNFNEPAIKHVTLRIRKTIIGTSARRKALQAPKRITIKQELSTAMDYYRTPINPERSGFDHGKSNTLDGNFSDVRMENLVGKHGDSMLSVFFARILCACQLNLLSSRH